MKLFSKLFLLTVLAATLYLVFTQKTVNIEYPFAQINQIFSQEQVGPIELIFAGDIMLDRGLAEKIKANNNWRWPFLEIASTTQKADIVFGNLEGPISQDGQKNGKENAFEMDPQTIEGLAYANFNVLSLANNHTMDYGAEAFLDTILRLKSAGIDSVGGGKNETEAKNLLIKEINKTKFGFLAYNENCTTPEKASSNSLGMACLTKNDLEVFKKDVSRAKKKVDILIVSLHHGKEYTKTLSQFQNDFSKAAIDEGADLVIGHHPHVVQKYEQYKEGWIFYSLGNFIFDQTFLQETMQGLMAKVIVENKKIKSVEPIKTQITNSFQVKLAETNAEKLNEKKAEEKITEPAKPEISLSPAAIVQGSTLLIQIKNIENVKNVTGEFISKKISFFKLNGKFYGLTSVAAKTAPGSYKLVVSLADGSQIKKTVEVQDANFKVTVLAFTPELEEKGYNATSVAQTIANNDQIKLAEAMADSADIPYFNSSFTYPLEKIIKVGAYGSIRQSGDISLQHLGVDLDADTGTPVYAINDGKVVGVLDLINYGNTVVIDHGMGIFSLYLHLDKFKVYLGQKVKKNQTIGLSGNTGYSIAPHLHFSIKVSGSSVDPLSFIKTAKF